MVQFFILALALVLLVYIIKLNNKLDKFNKGLDNFTANIFEDFDKVKADIANSTSKIQDRICGVHESIENHQKDMVELIKRAFEEQIHQMKLVEKLNTSNTRDIVSTATKDISSSLADVYEAVKNTQDRLDAHNNYVIAHCKET